MFIYFFRKYIVKPTAIIRPLGSIANNEIVNQNRIQLSNLLGLSLYFNSENGHVEVERRVEFEPVEPQNEAVGSPSDSESDQHLD
jgi:hypothetical protein